MSPVAEPPELPINRRLLALASLVVVSGCFTPLNQVFVDAGATCPTGTTACGGSGQACCASSLCGSGLVCTAGVCAAAVTPNRTPYQKCSATDVCATGTQCLTSIVAAGAAKAPGTSCTVACPSGLPSACPGYVPGAATQSVTCLSVGTPAQSQCYRLCATQTDCTDFNTTCSAIPAAGGGTVRVCVAVGPRA